VSAVHLFSRVRGLALALALAVLALCAFALAPSGAGAATAAPAWKLSVVPMPTTFVPGAKIDVPGFANSSSAGPFYKIAVTNVGEDLATAPITVTDVLPAGLTAPGCGSGGQVCTFTVSETIYPGGAFHFRVGVDVDAGLEEGSTLQNEVTVSSPGAAPTTASVATTISSEPAPFGLIPGPSGLSAILSEADGFPDTGAGSHPSQLTIGLALQSRPGSHATSLLPIMPSGAGMRDTRTYLPRGLVIDPAGTPQRCTEAQFETLTCPDAAAIGRVNTMLSLGGSITFASDPLFNLVPPPGSASSFGFDPAATGLHVHVLGGLRAGDYDLAGTAEDLPAIFNNAVYGVQLQFWGDTSSPSHDTVRGVNCLGLPDLGGNILKCPVPQKNQAAVSLPTSCAVPMSLEAELDSWAEPGKWLNRAVPTTDLEGEPVSQVSGCNAVPFDPRLSVQPTTNLADSPSGLDVDLKIPQNESLEGTATAHLKTATVTLPEGLVVNPSSANGLEGCSSAQIGIDPATGIADAARAACPDASKIGNVEVKSPLLAEYNSENKVIHDAEGHVVPQPVEGAVYLATPHDNPFDSLLAIYLAIEDPRHGIVVKLAGHVQADPQTGRLTTTFADNPQLPVSEFKLHFFGGAAAALKTPLSCGTKTISSDLTPWSTPEGADATLSDSFQTTVEPGGGNCPSSDSEASNHPAFSAGTIAPAAGAYSPLVLKLAREDGSAPISAIDTTLPAGLTGKLAGIAYCPDGALAAAAAKSGNQEKQSPSCPASSEVGSVTVGAGAGPTPYYTQGKAYLAGPYKGAPLSLAIVTPATAGPYDLGTVVVRVALNVDPETTRIHAVSDPIPQILQGIPLDVRRIALKMDRPSFTLNPTSCDPMAITANAIPALGAPAALTTPFQVGGCTPLAFKPKLSLRLKGSVKRSSHPKLIASLTARPGEANIARAQVKLPRAVFLDQSHIGTSCTRVQFAANTCPARSVYGKVSATTPLLDYPLTGSVYLRSSNHILPDLVAKLKGPASQPIEIDLVGKTDSVKGALRNTFEAVPDAAVSKFRLELFGGKRGLVEMSDGFCAAPRATVQLDGQNGKIHDTRPVVRAKCGNSKNRGHRKQ
jgi:hypothetical protein